MSATDRTFRCPSGREALFWHRRQSGALRVESCGARAAGGRLHSAAFLCSVPTAGVAGQIFCRFAFCSGDRVHYGDAFSTTSFGRPRSSSFLFRRRPNNSKDRIPFPRVSWPVERSQGSTSVLPPSRTNGEVAVPRQKPQVCFFLRIRSGQNHRGGVLAKVFCAEPFCQRLLVPLMLLCVFFWFVCLFVCLFVCFFFEGEKKGGGEIKKEG
mmetsp:Transcript_21453/g.30292  ORF Transcript_21453/g.30292 Transcript_21453/m.30292 type:complete len:211 (+) Transcript_21453:4500-5132(+)